MLGSDKTMDMDMLREIKSTRTFASQITAVTSGPARSLGRLGEQDKKQM